MADWYINIQAECSAPRAGFYESCVRQDMAVIEEI